MRNVLPAIVRRRPVVDRATRLAIAVTLVALLVRIALVTFGADPVTPHYSDAEYYDVVARNLVDGNGFAYVHGASFFWPPGYPFFLAILYQTFHASVKVALMGNAFAGAATVLVTFLLGRRLWDARTGLIGASILALLPSHIFWTPVLLSEVLFTFVFAAGVLAALHAVRTASKTANWPALALFAALLAAGTMIRGQMLILLPAACLLWWRSGLARRQVAAMTMISLVAAASLVGLWMFRNDRVFDERAVFASNAGYNLRIGHNPRANGRFDFLPEFWPAGQEGDLTPEREREFNSEGTSRALRYAVSHPTREIALSAMKVYWTYRADIDSWVWIESFGRTPLPSPDLRTAIIRSTSASYYTLLILAVLSAPLTLGVRNPQALFLTAVIVFWTLVHVAFFGEPRFHVPLLPLAVLMSSRFLCTLGQNWRQFREHAHNLGQSVA